MTSHPPLQRRLLTMLISTIFLIWVVVSILVYRAAEDEVEEVFDADLARSAHILQALLLHEVNEEHEMASKAQEIMEELGAQRIGDFPRLARILGADNSEAAREKLEMVSIANQAGRRYGAELAFVARYADGSVMLQDRRAPKIPPGPDGLADVVVDGQLWRVYGATDDQTGFVVQVGEKLAIRAGLVSYIARNSLMPMVFALPVLAVMIWLVVGRALAPLKGVATEVSMRAPDSLEAIDDTNTPREIHGLVVALNQLFRRFRSVIQRERQFTADAAHELRTPLAALKTHLQVARAQSKEASTRQSLDRAVEGVDRATHTVEQLLLLARADVQETNALMKVSVSLDDVAVSVVSELSQLAFERDIDLGVDAPGPVVARGDAASLSVLVRNLVDNAVRYTPAGGTVTVSVNADDESAWIEVSDDGVGITADERSKVFNRFHRGTGRKTMHANGSGLGLSLVSRIASLHHAIITVADGLNGKGVAIKVVFPRAQAGQGGEDI